MVSELSPHTANNHPEVGAAESVTADEYEQGNKLPPCKANVGERALLGTLVAEIAPERVDMPVERPVDSLADNNVTTPQGREATSTEGERNRGIFLSQFDALADALEDTVGNYEQVNAGNELDNLLALTRNLMATAYISSSPELSQKAQRVYDALNAARRSSVSSATEATFVNLRAARYLLLHQDTTPRTQYDAGVAG